MTTTNNRIPSLGVVCTLAYALSTAALQACMAATLMGCQAGFIWFFSFILAVASVKSGLFD
jgi:hypothetical protein